MDENTEDKGNLKSNSIILSRIKGIFMILIGIALMLFQVLIFMEVIEMMDTIAEFIRHYLDLNIIRLVFFKLPYTLLGIILIFFGVLRVFKQNQIRNNRLIVPVLGLLLGFCGIHNFMLGQNRRGFIKLALTLLSVGYLGLISWLWAIGESISIALNKTPKSEEPHVLETVPTIKPQKETNRIVKFIARNSFRIAMIPTIFLLVSGLLLSFLYFHTVQINMQDYVSVTFEGVSGNAKISSMNFNYKEFYYDYPELKEYVKEVTYTDLLSSTTLKNGSTVELFIEIKDQDKIPRLYEYEFNNRVEVTVSGLQEVFSFDTPSKETQIWKVDEYPEIKKIVDDFFQRLDNANVNYWEIRYEIAKYVSGMYKIVEIDLYDGGMITMKFSDDNKLLVLDLIGGSFESFSEDLQRTMVIMASFNYFNFTSEQFAGALSYAIVDGEYTAGNYKVTCIRGFSTIYTIEDIVNN